MQRADEVRGTELCFERRRSAAACLRRRPRTQGNQSIRLDAVYLLRTLGLHINFRVSFTKLQEIRETCLTL